MDGTTSGAGGDEREARLLEPVGAIETAEVALGRQPHPLAAAAAAAGFTSLIGTIVLAGRYASGSTWVQFNADSDGGYASAWPEWAFGIAEEALLAGKKVWVLSNGDPFGSNLTSVLLYAP
jgi:hypothetical protein